MNSQGAQLDGVLIYYHRHRSNWFRERKTLAQGWFKRSFGWIGDDFRRLFALLKQREMWILIGIAAVFAVIVYYGFQFALKFDFMMRVRNLTANACQELGNSATALLFFAMIFLGLTISMVFGEFARHLDYKRQKARALAREAAKNSGLWGVAALSLGVTMVSFLHSQCI
jgi:hypothetical protein